MSHFPPSALLIKFHHASPGLGVKRFQQHFFSLGLQTATDEFSGIDLIGETASPGEAMMSIKALHASRGSAANLIHGFWAATA